jgi:Holliday junction resolvase RusA-like endonuclease
MGDRAMTRIEFTVLGKPQPGGSKKWLPRKGRIGGRPLVVDDNPKTKPWQALVSAAAYDALDGQPPLEGPLLLEIDFYLTRPAGHYGSGRNRQTIKPSSPRFPAVRPDVTKLIRAVEDALTGLAWRDDAQVVTQTARKRYGHPERAEILVWQVNELVTLEEATAEGLFA